MAHRSSHMTPLECFVKDHSILPTMIPFMTGREAVEVVKRLHGVEPTTEGVLRRIPIEFFRRLIDLSHRTTTLSENPAAYIVDEPKEIHIILLEIMLRNGLSTRIMVQDHYQKVRYSLLHLAARTIKCVKRTTFSADYLTVLQLLMADTTAITPPPNWAPMPVDILDSEGKTPLQECVFNGNPDTDHYFWRVQYLLQMGANPNAVDGRNSLKTRPLYLATMPYGNRIPRSVRKIVNILEAAGARSTP
ncbi:Protein of unknown function [Pyronema omphalodes CBS 100304]|uniref:Uncharacterized protein n=1 Tax=Pyronema omphalodes (strain CBS 100304) TaxID=1076935 RepID=U4KUC1_PYROM|nr:Protein of unknown function [Pyronema omphalodes CBS 100304]